MTSSMTEVRAALVRHVEVTDDALTVSLRDGRSVAVPLEWYPRLQRATAAERADWRLIGRGEGIHWPAIDEDISVTHLLEGTASGESARSLESWSERRHKEASAR